MVDVNDWAPASLRRAALQSRLSPSQPTQFPTCRPKHFTKLLRYGADPDLKDLSGRRALHWYVSLAIGYVAAVTRYIAAHVAPPFHGILIYFPKVCQCRVHQVFRAPHH